MADTREKDLFDYFGLDRNNPFVEWFVFAASEAAAKLNMACENENTPALAFNEFVKAWDYYGIMPDSVREECEGMVKFFRDIWKDVAEAEAEYFYYLCNAVISGETGADEPLSIACIELLEALTTLEGNLPEANNIFVAALTVATSGQISLASCNALLYVLCARIWYRSLGLSCNEEDALLSEGLKYHRSVLFGDVISSTELYAIHIAAAIDDSIYLSQKRGGSPVEMFRLVREGYIVLAKFNSLNADLARHSLFERTGITAEMALFGEQCFSVLPTCGKRMDN